MPNTGEKKSQGDKTDEQSLLGEAALKEALAGFGAAADAPDRTGASSNGSHDQRGASAARTGTEDGVAGARRNHLADDAEPAPQIYSAWRTRISSDARDPAKQFRIFYKGEQPVGVAVWALVDEIVAKRIDGGDKRLTAVEWKSGTNMRIVDVVAPFGGEAEMRKIETS